MWGRAYSCWMLNCWCITWPVGFMSLISSSFLFHFHILGLKFFYTISFQKCSVAFCLSLLVSKFLMHMLTFCVSIRWPEFYWLTCKARMENVKMSVILTLYHHFQVTIATDLGKLVTQIQLERSEVAFFIFTNGSKLRYVTSPSHLTSLHWPTPNKTGNVHIT